MKEADDAYKDESACWDGALGQKADCFASLGKDFSFGLEIIRSRDRFVEEKSQRSASIP